MKYENLKDIKFVGDLSLEDADLLAFYGFRSDAILEFGVGGSTQILSQCLPDLLVSVETDPEWIAKTENRLSQLTEITKPLFCAYGNHPSHKYDLIFVDGVDHLRRQFAIDTWSFLAETGVMIFHDTRRFEDFQNAAWVAQLFHNEIDSIDINVDNSNMTIIHKKKLQPYVNWNYTEDKPLWAYGLHPNPNGEELWTIKY